MRSQVVAILAFTMLFSAIPKSVWAQMRSDVSHSEVGLRVDLDSQEMPLATQDGDYYNPWRIHRKVAQYGLGASIAATFVGALATDDELFETTIIPVVGPFVTMARIEGSDEYFYQSGGRTLLIASGVTQTAFLAYFVVALIGEKNFDGRYRSGYSVHPAMGKAGTGITISYRF